MIWSEREREKSASVNKKKRARERKKREEKRDMYIYKQANERGGKEQGRNSVQGEERNKNWLQLFTEERKE